MFFFFEDFADETALIAVHCQPVWLRFVNQSMTLLGRVIGLTTNLFSLEHSDWSQRASVHLHCDVTIETSAINIW